MKYQINCIKMEYYTLVTTNIDDDDCNYYNYYPFRCGWTTILRRHLNILNHTHTK